MTLGTGIAIAGIWLAVAAVGWSGFWAIPVAAIAALATIRICEGDMTDPKMSAREARR